MLRDQLELAAYRHTRNHKSAAEARLGRTPAVPHTRRAATTPNNSHLPAQTPCRRTPTSAAAATATSPA